MAEYRNEYGRRWNVKLPRRDIKYLLGMIHCATPLEDVLSRVSEECIKANIPARMRQSCAKYAEIVWRRQSEIYRMCI